MRKRLEKMWNKISLILTRLFGSNGKRVVSNKDAGLFDCDQTDTYVVSSALRSNSSSGRSSGTRSFGNSTIYFDSPRRLSSTGTAERVKVIGPRSSSLSDHSEPLGVPTIDRTFHRVNGKKLDLYKRRAVQLMSEEEDEILTCDPDSEMIIATPCSISAASEIYDMYRASYINPEEILSSATSAESATQSNPQETSLLFQIDQRLVWTRCMQGDGLDNLDFSSSSDED